MVQVATPQDRPLLKVLVVGKPRKNLRDDVLLACVAFLLEPLHSTNFALLTARMFKLIPRIPGAVYIIVDFFSFVLPLP